MFATMFSMMLNQRINSIITESGFNPHSEMLLRMGAKVALRYVGQQVEKQVTQACKDTFAYARKNLNPAYQSTKELLDTTYQSTKDLLDMAYQSAEDLLDSLEEQSIIIKEKAFKAAAEIISDGVDNLFCNRDCMINGLQGNDTFAGMLNEDGSEHTFTIQHDAFAM